MDEGPPPVIVDDAADVLSPNLPYSSAADSREASRSRALAALDFDGAKISVGDWCLLLRQYSWYCYVMYYIHIYYISDPHTRGKETLTQTKPGGLETAIYFLKRYFCPVSGGSFRWSNKRFIDSYQKSSEFQDGRQH